MPFLPDLLTKLKKPGAALAGFFRTLPGRFLSLLALIREKGLRSGVLFREKRKWLLAGLGAVLVLLLLSVVLLIGQRGSRAGPPEDPAGPVQGFHIPREELFLPDEPDFIPGVLLERMPRESWTGEDAAPYWQDPLKSGEEPWREQAEAAIDELLERVP
ncbi:MAG: hypothetical protein LBK02_05550 [Treponema sp.]|jgi:hypothetical protein|nr:hypothetical protein [Treponema sp.]